MIQSRFVAFAVCSMGLMQCGGPSAPVTPPTTTSDAAVEPASTPDAGAPLPSGTGATATPDAAPAEPAPTAQDLCFDGQRVRFTVSVSGCGLKLGKSSTDEGRPGVVQLTFSTKSTCKKMDPVAVELMTTPLSQRRFQLIVQDDAGKPYADQMVTTTSLPACGSPKKK
jgi:hypothetical protein